MRLDTLFYRPFVIIEFSATEMSAMMDLSDIHYDYECKQASKPHGLLYGLNNRILFSEDHEKVLTHPLCFREVDLLAKVTEIATTQYASVTVPLHVQLCQLLGQMNDAASKVND